MFPTPTFEETATFEPAPFADLFGDPDDLFDAVRIGSFLSVALSAGSYRQASIC